MDLVRFLLPCKEKEPEEPEKKSTAASAAAHHQEPKQEQPRLQVAAVAPKGPLWSDLSSDEDDDGQAAQ